jgi:hypothetical protein
MNAAAKIGMMIAIAIALLTFSGMTAITAHNQQQNQQQVK